MAGTGQVARGAREAQRLLAERRPLRELVDRPRPGILVAEGDSWFDYPRTDVLSVLEDDFGWEVQSVTHRGDNLESMAYDRGQLEPLNRTFERVARRGETPAGVVISAGGNDFAGPELAVLLDHRGSDHAGINSVIADELVEHRLREAWEHLLGFTRQLTVELFDVPVRTVVHGYDYAVPDGRGFLGGAGPLPGPWLAPSYGQNGIGSQTRAGLRTRSDLTRELVDRYNVMLQALVAEPGLEHVVYVDLRGVLHARDYKDDWANELHPTQAGFGEVAARINGALLG